MYDAIKERDMYMKGREQNLKVFEYKFKVYEKLWEANIIDDIKYYSWLVQSLYTLGVIDDVYARELYSKIAANFSS